MAATETPLVCFEGWTNGATVADQHRIVSLIPSKLCDPNASIGGGQAFSFVKRTWQLKDAITVELFLRQKQVQSGRFRDDLLSAAQNTCSSCP